MTFIKGYEGKYSITEDGRVWSHKTHKWLATGLDRDGYQIVRIHDNGRETSKKVHRLVAETFLSNPDNLPEVNHIDEDKTNNSVTNLQWCTRKQNCQHSAHQKYKPVYCVELDKVFESIKAAIEYTGAKQIQACLAGRQPRAGGYHWRYVT